MNGDDMIKGNGTISSKDTFFAQRMMSEAMDHLPAWLHSQRWV